MKLIGRTLFWVEKLSGKPVANANSDGLLLSTGSTVVVETEKYQRLKKCSLKERTPPTRPHSLYSQYTVVTMRLAVWACNNAEHYNSFCAMLRSRSHSQVGSTIHSQLPEMYSPYSENYLNFVISTLSSNLTVGFLRPILATAWNMNLSVFANQLH